MAKLRLKDSPLQKQHLQPHVPLNPNKKGTHNSDLPTEDDTPPPMMQNQQSFNQANAA